MYIVGAILILSIAGVFIGSVTQAVAPPLLILVSYSVATLFFLVPKLKNPALLVKKIKSQWRVIFWINIWTAGCWFGWFYSLKIFEPAVGTMVANALAPVIILLLSNKFRPESRIFGMEKFASIGITTSLAVILILSFLGKSGVGVISQSDFTLGIIMTLIFGVAQPLYSLYSKRLFDNNFSSSDLMGVEVFSDHFDQFESLPPRTFCAYYSHV